MTEKLATSINVLREQLALAFDTPSSTGSVDDPSRYVYALQKVAEYLQSQGISHAHCDRFFELAQALEDLNRGRVAPMLSPFRAQNRTPEPTNIWIQRATVCLGLIELVAAGQTKAEAA
jgi:hypothetical protein